MATTMVILSFSVFSLSIWSFLIDHDGIIHTFTSFVLLSSIVSIVEGIKRTFCARDKEEDNNEQEAGDWNENNRLGKSLSLREDLYSWALVTCFDREYLAQIMFFNKREAEKKKMEDKLADANEWLENSRTIDEEANSNNEGDFSNLVAYHEKLVAKKESVMPQEDMPTIEEFRDFVKKCANEEWFDQDGKAMNRMKNNKRFLVICQLLLIGFLFQEAFSSGTVELYLVPPTANNIVMCRFLCAVFMHITLSKELTQSFNTIKFALNHPWKF